MCYKLFVVTAAKIDLIENALLVNQKLYISLKETLPRGVI
jgi:hypothetical protein